MTLKDESEINVFFRHPKDEKIHHTIRGFKESPSNKNQNETRWKPGSSQSSWD